MKSRETLIRLKKFQVDEKRRRVAQIEGMGGSAIGVLFAIQSLGSSIGPLVCGAIADSYGLLATFYFLVATIIVANMPSTSCPARAATVISRASSSQAASPTLLWIPTSATISTRRSLGVT